MDAPTTNAMNGMLLGLVTAVCLAVFFRSKWKAKNPFELGLSWLVWAAVIIALANA